MMTKKKAQSEKLLISGDSPRCVVPISPEITEKLLDHVPQFLALAVNTKLALRLCAHTFEHNLDIFLKTHDLTMAKFNALIMVYINHPIPVPTADVAKCWIGTRANLSQLITALTKEGLLQTITCPHDARARLLKITPKGQKKVQAILPIHVDHINRLVNTLTETEQNELVRLLLKMHDGIVAIEQDGKQDKPQKKKGTP